MTHDEKLALIERYLTAYNTFDIEGMLAVMHPDIVFKNISGGEVNAAAYGKEELRRLAGKSKNLFVSRRQTVMHFEADEDQASADVAFTGVPAADLPNGMKKGETLRLNGRSEFRFREGKIVEITDIA
ncbi:MAG: nuclear transport factor 2 family protein [Desulfobacterales bacterium]